MKRTRALALAFLCLLDASSAQSTGPNADLGGRLLLPADDEWNRDVSRDAVDPSSDAIIASISADKPLHEDFGLVWKGAHTIAVAADGSVYALGHDRILRVSRDHGASWNELTKPPVAKNSSDTPAFPLVLADGTLCVACRPSPGLAISQDGGKSWKLSLAGSIILTARAAPPGGGRDGTIFAFDSAGNLHRSDDRAATFTVVKKSPHQWEPGLRFAGGLAVNAAGKIMLWSLGELVVSADWGQTWTRHRIETHWDRGSYAGMNRHDSPEGKCSTLAVTADGRVWLKCDSSLLCRSADDGVSWTGSTTGLQVLCYLQGPAISPHDPRQAMVAALDQGVFKTSDDGATWQPMRIEREWWDGAWQNHDGSVVKAHPVKPRTWFAIIHGHGGDRHPRLHRTDDGGATWRLVLDVRENLAASGDAGSTTAKWATCVSILRIPKSCT